MYKQMKETIKILESLKYLNTSNVKNIRVSWKPVECKEYIEGELFTVTNLTPCVEVNLAPQSNN